MALSAAHRHTHPNGHGRIDPVDDRDVSKFFVVGASLVIGKCVSMESGSDELIGGGFR